MNNMFDERKRSSSYSLISNLITFLTARGLSDDRLGFVILILDSVITMLVEWINQNISLTGSE